MFLSSFQVGRDLSLLRIYPIDICISGIVSCYFFITETGEECPCVMALKKYEHNFNGFASVYFFSQQSQTCSVPYTNTSTAPIPLPYIHTHHFNTTICMPGDIPQVFFFLI